MAAVERPVPEDLRLLPFRRRIEPAEWVAANVGKADAEPDRLIGLGGDRQRVRDRGERLRRELDRRGVRGRSKSGMTTDELLALTRS